MPDDEALRSALQDLGGTFTTSTRLRERTQKRVRQLRRRRNTGRAAAVLLVVSGVALAVPAIGSDDEPELTPGPAQTTETCDGEELIAADLDGDGRPDQVFGEWVDAEGNPADPGIGEYQIEVCTAAGTTASITGIGNGEALLAIDIEPDGRAELLVGGTSVSAVYLDLVVLVDDELTKVVEPETDGTLSVSAGMGFPEESDPEQAGKTTAYGCEDMDGDGRRELVQVSAYFGESEVEWSKEGFSVDGAEIVESYADSGTEPLPEDRIAFPATLTTPCEDASTGADPTDAEPGEFFDVPTDQWPDAGVAVVQGDETIFFFDDEGNDFGFLRDAALAGALQTGTQGPLEVTVDGSTFAATRAAVAEDPSGCEGGTQAGGVRVALCGGDPQLRRQIVVVGMGGDNVVLAEAAPGDKGEGHWRWALPSPDGQWVLAQWSGECEIPVAYLLPAAGGQPVAISGDTTHGSGSTDSIATGWTVDGQVIATFPGRGCGSSIERPGAYLVHPDSRDRTLVWPDHGGIRLAVPWRRVASTGTAPDPGVSDLQAPEPGREITFDGIAEWRVGQVLDPSEVTQYETPGSCGYWGPSEPSHDGDEQPGGLVAGANTATPAIRTIEVFSNPRYRTASGVGIGTKLGTLRRIYGVDLIVDRLDAELTATAGLTAQYNDVAAIRSGDRAITYILRNDVVIAVKVSPASSWGDDEGCA